jgi:hypothetical protein
LHLLSCACYPQPVISSESNNLFNLAQPRGFKGLGFAPDDGLPIETANRPALSSSDFATQATRVVAEILDMDLI